MPSRIPEVGGYVSLEVFDEEDANNLPAGWVGMIDPPVTTNQTGITTETDLTGLAETVTLKADRVYLLIASVPLSSATAGDRVGVNIKEGSTVLGSGQTTTEQTNVPYMITATALLVSPSAGVHTYKLTASLGGGSTGPIRTDHANGGKSLWALLEIGPAPT